MKSLVKIPFKCPHGKFSCPYVNTMTATLDKDCTDCDYKHDPVRETGGMPELGAIVNAVSKLKDKIKERLKK